MTRFVSMPSSHPWLEPAAFPACFRRKDTGLKPDESHIVSATLYTAIGTMLPLITAPRFARQVSRESQPTRYSEMLNDHSR